MGRSLYIILIMVFWFVFMVFWFDLLGFNIVAVSNDAKLISFAIVYAGVTGGCLNDFG